MTDPPSRFSVFIAELRHRRVFRVAAVYACVAFIIIQIIDGAFDYLRIPEWIGTTIIVLLALGFFIAVGLAWAFDLTEEGLVRTKPKREPTAAKAPHHIVIGNKTLAVIAVLAIVFGIWSWLREPSPGGAAISSLAVLPLENLMGDPEQEYFVDGMHEALTVELSKIGALRVIGRTSTMSYKANPKPIPEIAEELDVDAVIEGSVFQDGDLVRITAQLVATRPERHFWANDYEADLTDILVLQKTVAKAIAGEIGLVLTPEEEADLASAPRVNPEAYQLYLLGWHLRTLGTSESMPKAVEYLEQSIALDSTFALAWVALGHSYLLMQWQGGWTGDYALERMKPALDKSLELDPTLPEAHAGLGLYQELARYDMTGAETSFRRALELNPDNNYAVYEYGMFLFRTGRPDEALEQYQRGQKLDPLDPQPYDGIYYVYSYTRQYEKQLEQAQLRDELAGNSGGDYSGIERNILMQQGRYAEVAEQMGVNTTLGMRARMAMGNVEEVYFYRDSLRSTGELQQRDQEDPLWSARFYGIIGEKELALGLLEKRYEDNAIDYLWRLIYLPEFDSLRAEPRFKALMQKMGLTEVFDQYGQRIR